MKHILYFLPILFCLLSCTQTINQSAEELGFETIPLEYSNGFRIDTLGGKTKLTIFNTADSNSVLGSFTLLPQDYKGKLQANEIKVPCRRIICLSSTQLAYLIELDALDNVVGINSSRHLFNKTMIENIKKGKVRRVGKEGVFNNELIAAINPDVIFVSPFKTGGYDALQQLGFPLIPMAAYSEQLPLGRAEWIKLMALFVDKEKQADSIFSNIASQYNRLKKLSSELAEKPTVFSGKMKGGTWYVAGGNSFFAHMFRDAGADYVFKNEETGAVPMDYEVVYKTAYNAKFWRLLTSSPSGFGKEMLQAEDIRYTDFEAYKTGNILVCNLREIPYREESCVKPHILLADYIKHFHPGILEDYKPVYWTKIAN